MDIKIRHKLIKIEDRVSDRVSDETPFEFLSVFGSTALFKLKITVFFL